MSGRFIIHEAEVLAAFAEIPSCSWDCAYSDVPYGLGPKQPTREELISYLQGFEMDTRGDFMGAHWNVPSVNVWREMFRVLKPGAPLFINAAPRTEDLVALGMRAAGFEIGDIIMWMFSGSMPKSHNIALAAEKLGESETAIAFEGFGTALAPGYEPVILAWKPNDGTYVHNATVYGCGALNIDGCRIFTDRNDRGEAWKNSGHSAKPDAAKIGGAPPGNGIVCHPKGRWPKNVILDAQTGAWLDEMTGELISGNIKEDFVGDISRSVALGAKRSMLRTEVVYGDRGGASRFYYCASATREERDLGCEHLPLRRPGEAVHRTEGTAGIKSGRAGAGRTGDGVRNHGPAVKPIALTRYLAKLGLPPARATDRVLGVPYCGTGSEIVGALLAGWERVVGIERDPDFVAIANARCTLAETNPRAFEALIDGELKRGEEVDERQLSLIGDP